MSKQRYQWTLRYFKLYAVVVYNTLPVARKFDSEVTINCTCIRESIEPDVLVDRVIPLTTNNSMVVDSMGS